MRNVTSRDANRVFPARRSTDDAIIQFTLASLPLGLASAGSQAAAVAERKAVWRTITAHAVRAIFLANATATTILGRLASNRTSQGLILACLPVITAIAPFTSSFLKYASPRSLMPPSLTFPPLEFCPGVSPR